MSYKSEWVEEKSWQDFRDTGLFMFMNTILDAFGWAICVEVDDQTGEIKHAFPARVKFRGFTEKDTSEMHIKIGKYLAANSEELKKETEL